MGFADPQSVTVNSVAQSLASAGTSLTEAKFMGATGEFSLLIKHSAGSRYRHLAQLRQTKIVSNPLVPSQNIPVEGHAHLVVDFPKNGMSVAEAADLAKAIVGWATPANILKLVSGEL